MGFWSQLCCRGAYRSYARVPSDRCRKGRSGHGARCLEQRSRLMHLHWRQGGKHAKGLWHSKGAAADRCDRLRLSFEEASREEEPEATRGTGLYQQVRQHIRLKETKLGRVGKLFSVGRLDAPSNLLVFEIGKTCPTKAAPLQWSVPEVGTR